MEKIIQLRDYEYNELIEKAKLNEQQIEEKALSLWKEKGAPSITVKLEIREDYDDYQYIDCFTFFHNGNHRFEIPEKIRSRFEQIIKNYTKDFAKIEFGDIIKAINNLNKEYRDFRYLKYILYTIAASGWAAFVSYLCWNKLI